MAVNDPGKRESLSKEEQRLIEAARRQEFGEAAGRVTVTTPPPDSGSDDQSSGVAEATSIADVHASLLEALIAPAGDDATEKAEAELARYEVLESLGKGGMGEVHKAHDRRLGRPVALKRIGPHIAKSPSAMDRFLAEARAVAVLNHYNIVQVYDIDKDADGHFITMEYIEGEDLKTKIERDGKLDPERAVEITRQLCNALSYAHGRGIIHRDIKPANILINTQGTPKLVDFGLARIEHEAGPTLTHTGAMIGTIDYASPEQMTDSKNADHRSDIYSLGATLYQMLTGLSPRRVEEDNIPEEFRPCVLKSVNPDRNQRYQSAEEFNEALDQVVIGDVDTLMRKAEVCYQGGDIEGALQRYERVLRINPDHATARRHAELMQSQIKDIHQARRKANHAANRGNWEAAAAAWQRVLDAAPGDVEAIQQHARAEGEIRHAELTAAIEKARRKLKNGDPLAALAQCELAAQIDPDNQEVAEIREAARAGKRRLRNHKTRAGAEAFKQQDYAAATVFLTEALKLTRADHPDRPKLIQARNLAQASQWIAEAERAVDAGEILEASRLLDQAENKAGGHEDLVRRIAEGRKEITKAEGAATKIKNFIKRIHQAPTGLTARLTKAPIQTREKRFFSRQATKIGASVLAVVVLIGLAVTVSTKVRARRAGEAIENAYSYIDEGNWDAAREEIDRARQIDPYGRTFEEVKQVLLTAQRREQYENLLAQARRAITSEMWNNASEFVDQAKELLPGDPAWQKARAFLVERAQQKVQDELAWSSEYLAKRRWPEALHAVDRASAVIKSAELDPANFALQRVRDKINKAKREDWADLQERFDQSIERWRFDDAQAARDEALKFHPDPMREIHTWSRQLSERRSKADSVESEVKKLLDSHQFDEAREKAQNLPQDCPLAEDLKKQIDDKQTRYLTERFNASVLIARKAGSLHVVGLCEIFLANPHAQGIRRLLLDRLNRAKNALPPSGPNEPIPEVLANLDTAVKSRDHLAVVELVGRLKTQFPEDQTDKPLQERWPQLQQSAVQLGFLCRTCIGRDEIDCPQCKGTGKQSQWDCEACQGQGQLQACPTCFGGGKRKCTRCGGDGRIWELVPAPNGGFLVPKKRVSVNCPKCVEGKVICTICKGKGGPVICKQCNGAGKSKNPRPAKCSRCKGKGKIPCPAHNLAKRPEPEPAPHQDKNSSPVLFWGVRFDAKKVVYVVDRSGSMINTFDALSRGLQRSIDQLSDEQFFHIIFFSEKKPIEKRPARLVPATKENKAAAFRFLQTIIPEGRTDPTEAMRRAFEVRPDAICFLIDGEFNPGLLAKLRAWNKQRRVRIHTYAYVYQPGKQLLEQIAREHGGRYHFISEDDVFENAGAPKDPVMPKRERQEGSPPVGAEATGVLQAKIARLTMENPELKKNLGVLKSDNALVVRTSLVVGAVKVVKDQESGRVKFFGAGPDEGAGPRTVYKITGQEKSGKLKFDLRFIPIAGDDPRVLKGRAIVADIEVLEIDFSENVPSLSGLCLRFESAPAVRRTRVPQNP